MISRHSCAWSQLRYRVHRDSLYVTESNMRLLQDASGLEFAQDMLQNDENTPEIKRAAAEILLATGNGNVGQCPRAWPSSCSKLVVHYTTPTAPPTHASQSARIHLVYVLP